MKFTRRIRILPAAFALFAAIAACAPGTAPAAVTPEVSPAAASSASPSPRAEKRTIAVFGADASESFQDGVSQAAGGAYEIEFYSGGADALAGGLPGGAAAAIVYLGAGESWSGPSGFPVFVYAADGQTVSPDVPHLTYFGLNAAADALSLAVEYPPHETPVRIVGLFTSKTSRAYTVWTYACRNGRVFSKAEYAADRSGLSAKEWFADRLDDLYPGMIDAVFAETGELAAAAADVLAGLGRTDMEVFAASAGGNAELRLSPVLTAVVGADERRAGTLCCEGAAALLSGETPDNAQIGSSVFRYSPAKR